MFADKFTKAGTKNIDPASLLNNGKCTKTDVERLFKPKETEIHFSGEKGEYLDPDDSKAGWQKCTVIQRGLKMAGASFVRIELENGTRLTVSEGCVR